MSNAGLDAKPTATAEQYQALFAVSDAIASHRELTALFHELAGRLGRVVSFDALSLVSQFEDPSTRHAGTLRLPRVDDD